MANPDPEIDPKIGDELSRIFATGRSDYPNQINNALSFPGIFRRALDVQASEINEPMKLAAARHRRMCAADALSEDYIIPSVFDREWSRVLARPWLPPHAHPVLPGAASKSTTTFPACSQLALIFSPRWRGRNNPGRVQRTVIAPARCVHYRQPPVQ